jgi:hypothetical protein
MQLQSSSSSEPNNLPAGIPYPLMSFEQLEKYAAELASYYDFRIGPFMKEGQVDIDLVAENLCKERGYRIQFVLIPGFTDGDCKEYGRTIFSRKLIEIAEPNNLFRIDEKTIRTTQAHEMYHALTHEEYALAAKPREFPKKLEKNAKDFARIFLLPEKEFSASFKSKSDEHALTYSSGVLDETGKNLSALRNWIIPALSDEFGISTFSISLRIKDLNLLGSRDLAQKHLLDGKPIYRS